MTDATVSPESSIDVRFRLDGREVTCQVSPRDLLSDVLRHELGATGVHVGCEQGACGACTVTFDGAVVRSCLMLAVQAEGHEVTTVASLGSLDRLHPLQEAFRSEYGLQCGYCTPGILVSMAAAAGAGASVTQAVADVLPGHLCRCTGYAGIRAAVRRAWPELAGAPGGTRTDGGPHGGPHTGQAGQAGQATSAAVRS